MLKKLLTQKKFYAAVSIAAVALTVILMQRKAEPAEIAVDNTPEG